MLSQSLSVTEVRSGDPELAATRYCPAETQRSMATPLAFVSCMMSAAGSAFVSRAEGHSQLSACTIWRIGTSNAQLATKDRRNRTSGITNTNVTLQATIGGNTSQRTNA